jgi:hypothetical protein
VQTTNADPDPDDGNENPAGNVDPGSVNANTAGTNVNPADTSVKPEAEKPKTADPAKKKAASSKKEKETSATKKPKTSDEPTTEDETTTEEEPTTNTAITVPGEGVNVSAEVEPPIANDDDEIDVATAPDNGSISAITDPPIERNKDNTALWLLLCGIALAGAIILILFNTRRRKGEDE